MSQIVQSAAQEIDAPVTDFTLTSIQGQVVNFNVSLRGAKGAVVVFWSSVCSHCIRYDSYLNSFSQKHPELRLLIIASRQGETPRQIHATIAQRKLQLSILHDHGGRVARSWFVQQTPRVFLVDANGALRYRGAIDNYKYSRDIDYVAYLEPAIAEFIAGKPLSRTETASFGCAIRSVYYNFPKAL